MYGIYTYMWWIFLVNVGKYTMHGSFGDSFWMIQVVFYHELRLAEEINFLSWLWCTPPKTNMAAENPPFEDAFPVELFQDVLKVLLSTMRFTIWYMFGTYVPNP